MSYNNFIIVNSNRKTKKISANSLFAVQRKCHPNKITVVEGALRTHPNVGLYV